jgi:hypothetical protein
MSLWSVELDSLGQYRLHGFQKLGGQQFQEKKIKISFMITSEEFKVYVYCIFVCINAHNTLIYILTCIHIYINKSSSCHCHGYKKLERLSLAPFWVSFIIASKVKSSSIVYIYTHIYIHTHIYIYTHLYL